MPSYSDMVLDALGGTTAVSRKMGAPLSTVHSWRANGIPTSRLAHLKLIAQSEGISIDWETGRKLGDRVEVHAIPNTAPEARNHV